MNSTAQLNESVTALLGQQHLVVADVGAAYGLPAHLRVLENVATVYMFEPHEQRARELQEDYGRRIPGGRARVWPIALSGTGGERTLYITNVPTGSSLLEPGSEAARDRANPDYFYPMKKVTVRTQRLEAALADSPLRQLDFIKLDIQGAELEVLQGMASEQLSGLLGVELEIGFPGAYLSQPSFAQINEYLESGGLELFDLKPVRGHRHLPGANVGSAEDVFGVAADAPSISKRLWEADAIYFRPLRNVLASGDVAALRRLMVLECAYGFFTEAHHAVEASAKAGLVSSIEARELKLAITSWHRIGRYATVDSLTWRRWTSPWQSRIQRFMRRFTSRRVAGWLDQ